jgi:hypothetical protein
VAGVAVTVLASLAATAVLAVHAGCSRPPGPAQDAWSDAFAERFTEGDSSAGAMFRYWLPGGAVDEVQVVREIEAIADAGYKGVEIAHVMDGARYPVDPDLYGYGTDRWNQAVRAALEAADRRGLQVDLNLGSRWPMAVPGLDIDGLASSKELAYGYALVEAGGAFKGDVPSPEPRTYEDRSSVDGVISTDVRTADPVFITATAVRCRDDCPAQPLEVDLGSHVDLSADVGEDGQLKWTAPDDGTWVVVGFWYRGTAQRNDAPFGSLPHLLTDPEARVVDHYSRAGTDAFLEYFGGLLDDDTRRLLRRTGGSFFEDSLELSAHQVWTPRFLEHFEAQRGYSLLPYLTAVARRPRTRPFAPPPPAFSFADADAAVAERVGRDFEQTLNDLYLEVHVEPIMQWAASLGLTYRAQPYGEPLDLAQASALIDIPECESLGCRNPDDWRMMASGADMAGRPILSSEMLPGGFGGSLRLTREAIVGLVNREYALGANQMVFHGFPYAHWPESADGTGTDSWALWPGFHAFPSRIPEPFGPRQPEWQMEREIAGYYARTQLVLQEGKRRTDVAVYNQSLGHISAAYPDEGLLEGGYSYGYVSPGSLTLPAARVADGRLAPEGPAFKALVINDQASMPAAAARQTLQFARDGLPVLVVGQPPSRTPGYAATGEEAAQGDAKVRSVLTALLDEPKVRRVADTAGVREALAAMGVVPAASSSEAAIRSVHRAAPGVDYYWLYNPSPGPVTADVSLAGSRGGIPYELDPWTGGIARMAQYTVDGEGYRIAIALSPQEARTIAIRTSSSGQGPHVTDTTADSAQFVGDELVVRASSDGSYTTTLSDGRTVSQQVAGVLPAMEITRWDLAVDEYLPGSGDDPSSHTNHAAWQFDALELVPWAEIPKITDAVGLGRYTATVELTSPWTPRHGAYLDLGTVNGTYRVRVNGKDAGPVNQLRERLDVGPYLAPGSNRIEVEVATTMVNRLRVLRPDEFESQAKQDYGLLGPAVLRPYVQVTVPLELDRP